LFVWLSQFFISAAARKLAKCYCWARGANRFVSRRASAVFSELGFRGSLLGFRSFCWRDGDKEQFLWSSRVKIFLFRVGIAQFCLEVALSGFPGGLDYFCG
jgi:hypothetical protein